MDPYLSDEGLPALYAGACALNMAMDADFTLASILANDAYPRPNGRGPRRPYCNAKSERRGVRHSVGASGPFSLWLSYNQSASSRKAPPGHGKICTPREPKVGRVAFRHPPSVCYTHAAQNRSWPLSYPGSNSDPGARGRRHPAIATSAHSSNHRPSDIVLASPAPIRQR